VSDFLRVFFGAERGKPYLERRQHEEWIGNFELGEDFRLAKYFIGIPLFTML
jgi:hypothetical protein